ncbi:MAG: hydroxyacid dehydrogenase [Defluviimonas sp.]|uniref:hydroxyacid dehydrogenase n=1 Tax=Albidovulum sp. TaxID=1872424 RepID=UPI001E146DD3|nr:hydroxyacid dehydrogenase [Paracoccaceae bacterium]MCC0063153.1 hydroxyacid dehydrogenase [Defluviimonas sp.]
MAQVVIAGRIHPAGMAILEAEPGLGIDAITDPGAALPPEKLAAADALLIRYGALTEEQAAAMPNLKVVSRHGVGCDNLPVAALAARGVPVTIVGPVNAVSVAEQVMAMLMALIKRIVPYDAAVRKGNWAIRDSLAVGELSGRRLMLLGFGRIGREVARRAAAFDMQVLVHDPFVGEDAIRAAGYAPVGDWRAALPDVDAISLHLPATAETRGLIGAAELERMKPTAILLNAARGGLVDEEALHRALAGRMAQGGAGIDCFGTEPPDPGLPLLGMQNVVLSPHSAALSHEAARRMAEVAARNVIAGLNGTLDPALVFNLDALRKAGHVL